MGEEWKYAIIGIGLNINQDDFGSFKDRAVSLKQVTGKTYNTVDMAKELIASLQLSFKALVDETETMVRNYHEHLYKWKEKASLKKNDQVFEAIIKEVRADGMLVVQHEKEEIFKVGEIEWL